MTAASRQHALGLASAAQAAASQGSLRGRLTLLAAASIVPMLMLFAAEGYGDYRAERARAGQRQLEVTRSMTATVERELAGAIASLQMLALSPRLQQNDLSGFRALALRFEATQKPGSAVVLLDAAGQELVNTNIPLNGVLRHRTAEALAAVTKPVFATAAPVISSLFPRALDGSLVATIDVPVLRDGQVIYDLSMLLPPARLSAIITRQHLPPGTVTAVLDRNGVNVARVPDPEHFTGHLAAPSLLPHLFAAQEGVASTVSLEGVPIMTSFSHTQPSGWAVVMGVPEVVLRAPLRRSLWLLLGAGLIGTASSLAVAYALAQRVLLPMHALARYAADPAHPPTAGVFRLREVDAVAEALRHSLTERQTAMTALQALNESLEARVRQEIASRQQAQAQLAHAQRMEALGQLAGGIAHDFNNVLQAVTGGLSLIQRRPSDAEAVRRLSGMAADAAGRGAAITGRLLSFARRGELQAVPVQPAALLEGLREMLGPTLGSNIIVSVSTPASLPSLLADRAQLETALVNLAVNARDAMPHGGMLSLSAKAEMAGGCSDQPPDLAAGLYIRLTLADTGIGMDEATLDRASEPFFTTKAPGQGTGLGLSMARGFAQQSGGGLCIHSQFGAGTTVTLWFPQAGRDALPRIWEAQGAQQAGQPAMCVLMVDDDSMVREVLARELEDRGFLVTTASDGMAAMVLLDGGQPADLLVTDYAMPGMNGLATIAEARRRRPNLPALLLTGYAEADAGIGRIQDRLTILIRKPVSGEELAARCAGLRRRPPAGRSN